MMLFFIWVMCCVGLGFSSLFVAMFVIRNNTCIYLVFRYA
jgi:hypothetical protein